VPFVASGAILAVETARVWITIVVIDQNMIFFSPAPPE